MHAPKPPTRCPSCGERLSSLTRRWEKRGLRALRVPIAIIAIYFCGASIASRYVIDETGATWDMRAVAGCVGLTQDALDKFNDLIRAGRALSGQAA